MARNVLELLPVTEKDITADEYLNLTDEERAGIKDVKIIPPRIGARDFVRFRVTMKSPIFQMRTLRKPG